MNSRTINLILAAIFGVCGCYRDGIVQPESLAMYPESELLVTTHDGRKFNFAPNNHTVVTNQNGQGSIRGKAKVFRNEGPQFDWFEGELSFAEILTIATPEKTTFYYVLLTAIPVLIIIGIFFASGFS